MPSVFVKTLGCKVNSFDSHALENQLAERGFHIATSDLGADITIINSCSVTKNAEKEARYLSRRYKKATPETLLVITGCYAQVDSAKLVELPEVDFIVPNEVKENAAHLIAEAFTHPKSSRQKLPQDVSPVRENRQTHFKSSLTLFDRASSTQTRAFLKIQDGCNGFCTYCLIPYARGASRSVPAASILSEISRLCAEGVPEIVFTGIHIGDWGRDLAEYSDHKTPFVSLMQSIVDLPGNFRIRISSLEPREATKELIALMAALPERFCDHFHLPLQSGSDVILKKMRRSYTSDEYAQSVELIRSFFPRANIGADVIPGFPGETEDCFQETVAFVKKLKLNYLHVFPYSKRPNTAAMRLPHHVDAATIKERARILRQLSEQHLTDYYHKFIASRKSVVWENQLDELGRRKGLTGNYLNVYAPTNYEAHPGKLEPMLLKGFLSEKTFLGVPV